MLKTHEWLQSFSTASALLFFDCNVLSLFLVIVLTHISFLSGLYLELHHCLLLLDPLQVTNYKSIDFISC